MKHKHLWCVAIIMMSSTSIAWTQTDAKSTGVNFRGSYWKMSNQPTHIAVSSHGEASAENIGGGGLWLSFLSRMDQRMFLEFSLGAVGKVDEESTYLNKNEVKAVAITPLLLGFRYHLFSPQHQSALQPYFNFGAGAYWVTDILAIENIVEEKVIVDTKFQRGGYAGGGFNFMLTDWLGLNFDLKYHFLNFNKNDSLSGFEYGLGISLMWGQFKL